MSYKYVKVCDRCGRVIPDWAYSHKLGSDVYPCHPGQDICDICWDIIKNKKTKSMKIGIDKGADGGDFTSSHDCGQSVENVDK